MGPYFMKISSAFGAHNRAQSGCVEHHQQVLPSIRAAVVVI